LDRLAKIAWQQTDPLLVAALLLTSLLSIADYYLTLLILGLGGVEANPIFCNLIHGSPQQAYWLKLLLTAMGICFLAGLSRLRVAKVVAFALLAVYSVVISYELVLVGLMTG
jgi:hypothetical protein